MEKLPQPSDTGQPSTAYHENTYYTSQSETNLHPKPTGMQIAASWTPEDVPRVRQLVYDMEPLVSLWFQ
jgi:hypothetical protein